MKLRQDSKKAVVYGANELGRIQKFEIINNKMVANLEFNASSITKGIELHPTEDCLGVLTEEGVYLAESNVTILSSLETIVNPK